MLKAAKQKMKELERSTESKIKATALKAMEDFKMSTQFLDKKANFATATYSEGIKFAHNKFAPQYPKLDLGFLDEFYNWRGQSHGRHFQRCSNYHIIKVFFVYFILPLKGQCKYFLLKQ